MINASAGGSIVDMTYEDVRSLFEKIAKNGMTDYSDRMIPAKRQTFALEVDEVTGLRAQLVALTHEMNLMKAERQGKSMTLCGLCEGSHHTDQCQMVSQEVNFVQNRPTFGQGWNH